MEQYLTPKQVVELFLKAGNPRRHTSQTGGFYFGAMSFDSYDTTYRVFTVPMSGDQNTLPPTSRSDKV